MPPLQSAPHKKRPVQKEEKVMTDISVNTESIMKIGESFFRELEKEALQPFFRDGQMVAIYADASHGLFIDKGLITASRHRRAFGYWEYDITIHGKGVEVVVPSYKLRELSPEEIRALWCEIDGGRANAP
jgi:hypothetical protein